ncbi:MAG: DnaJ domain-containing protein [Chloroflexi bacterium]|nr:DnaJ domain-containing protein [Chloroflexota bacterium]
MPEQPDYYAILQVHPTATKEVIDAAYRKLASTHHPDVNDSTEAIDKMKLLNEAYEVLSDPSKRSSYDRNRQQTKANKGWDWRRLVIPMSLVLVILFAAKFGFRLALIFLVFLGILWLVQRIGK